MKRERTGETDGSMNALCDEIRRAASKYGKRETAGRSGLRCRNAPQFFLGYYMTVRVYRTFAAL